MTLIPPDLDLISYHDLLRSLFGLDTPRLGRLVCLDRSLALADSGCAGNGVFAEVGAVAALGSGVDD
jgi:hypothetical protein